MSSDKDSMDVLLTAQDKIFSLAVNRDLVDWKALLYEIIDSQGLNPWDIDISVFTKKYIETLQKLESVDFDVSGKFVLIAVYLLKNKSEFLLENDIRGMDKKISEINLMDDSSINVLSSEFGFDDDEDISSDFNDIIAPKKDKYELKYRNPIARKRKVTIFDLIKTLERTMYQSSNRKKNFFQRVKAEYNGPLYDKKPKDLSQLIEELCLLIESFLNDCEYVCFSNFFDPDKKSKIDVLEKFIPLLHLSNQEKILLNQDETFGEIKIYKNKELQ